MRVLKQIRRRRRITQAEFAGLIGISQSFLSELENGTGEASLKTLKKISIAIKTPVSKLIDS